MAKLLGEFEYKQERRLCRVGDEYGYFHCWEHYATPMEPSPMIGGSPGGQFSRVYGIVELEKGIRRVEINEIEFRDEEHSMLNLMNEHERKIGANNGQA